MDMKTSTNTEQDHQVFQGSGEMAELMRSLDWSKTPIEPVEAWSPALRMMVRFLLANRFPLLLWWGPQYVSIYNDAYRPCWASNTRRLWVNHFTNAGMRLAIFLDR